ncbi:MAG: hypothetical protein RL257_278, partial [Actinomycetota bacterium]
AAIAQQGHELVWGGGAISVMGEVAKGARQFGGKTIGVIPERLMNVEFIDHDSSELHVVADMRERKGLIERLSDGFIALPGGIGTLEEFFEIWVGRYLGFHNKPIAVLDPSSVYQTLRIALDDLTTRNFMKPGQHELVKWCSEITEALNHVGNSSKLVE